MQNFLNYDRSEPQKRNVLKRLKDFKEIYELFNDSKAQVQADRCVQCGDPYCLNACPLSNFIPQWLKKTSEKDIDFAFKISNDTSPFPEIMGRVCPQDRLCEGDCTLNDGFGAITIGSIETFISEEGFKKGLKPFIASKCTDKRVAVVGSGPASLSAATFLLRSGICVDMFERDDRAGGLLTYGIPGFKLDKKVVSRRVNWLLEAGMKLNLNCEIGKDVDFKELLDDYDAVFLGIGATKKNLANIENENAKNLYSAMELLKDVQKSLLDKKYIKKIDVSGKRVVVIGGGDTAMDCVRTSLREGASSVTCAYRRDDKNMPGSKKEFVNATEEGAEFSFNSSPKRILINSAGEVSGVEFTKTAMSEKDETGRASMIDVEGSEFILEADIVIMALGFSLENPNFLSANSIETDKRGRVVVNSLFQTSNSKVYAGGDCHRGANLVVTAAYEGREAAIAIAKKLLR